MKHLCHCCEPGAPATPLEVHNRPALPALRYRVGTYASFRAAMLRALADHPELRGLTTRETDDYGITVLELWSAVADVLTFYQERYANEAFLRTATFPDSVRRIARLIGYRPRPGVAARTWLAFTVDRDRPVTVPSGQQVQSVPEGDDAPLTFETLEEVVAHRALNRLRAFPAPVGANPLAAGTGTSPLDPLDGPALASELNPGDRVLLFEPGTGGTVEAKRVAALERRAHRVLLRWDEPVEDTGWSAGTHVQRTRRAFRLFGHDAAESWVEPVPHPDHPSDPTRVRWTLRSGPDLSLPAGDRIPLDGPYDDLRVGQRLVVADEGAGGSTTLVTVREVERTRVTVGGSSGTVTRLRVSPGLPAVADRRSVTIHELEGERIRLAATNYPDSFTGDVVHLPGVLRETEDGVAVEVGRVAGRDGFEEGWLLGPDELEPGRSLLLVDGRNEPVRVAVKEPPVVVPASASPGDACHLEVRCEGPALPTLETATAELLGNVVRASHGETVRDEAVGSGDASATFQEMELGRSPLTHLPEPAAPGGTEPALEVEVGGTPWRAVEQLLGQPADARVFELLHDPGGGAVLRFGDGEHGAVPPTGTQNVRATYRIGSGLAGRVGAGSLTTLAARPPGLGGVTNPIPAEGGADPEDLEISRLEAPRGVRTFGRIVSLRDFEDQATLSGEVARAMATAVWDGADRAVHLTLAGVGGAALSPTTLDDIGRGLSDVRDPNHRLRLDNPRPVYVQLTAGIAVEADADPDAVLEAARAAALEALAFDAVPLAGSVHLSDVYRVLQDVPGVAWVDVDRLQFRLDQFGSIWGALWELWRRGVDLSGGFPDPVQGRLRLFAAQPHPFQPGTILPAEMAMVQAPAEDVVIELREVAS